jgi:hypothetical protein
MRELKLAVSLTAAQQTNHDPGLCTDDVSVSLVSARGRVRASYSQTHLGIGATARLAIARWKATQERLPCAIGDQRTRQRVSERERERADSRAQGWEAQVQAKALRRMARTTDSANDGSSSTSGNRSRSACNCTALVAVSPPPFIKSKIYKISFKKNKKITRLKIQVEYLSRGRAMILGLSLLPNPLAAAKETRRESLVIRSIPASFSRCELLTTVNNLKLFSCR